MLSFKMEKFKENEATNDLGRTGRGKGMMGKNCLVKKVMQRRLTTGLPFSLPLPLLSFLFPYDAVKIMFVLFHHHCSPYQGLRKCGKGN